MEKRTMEQDTLQWKEKGKNATVKGGTISGREEMLRVNEEMRDHWAVNGFKSELFDYMNNAVTQRKRHRNAGNVALVNK